MKLAPFLLDKWLEQKSLPGSPIRHDLASSTGPSWTLQQLLGLAPDEMGSLLDLRLLYTTAAGSLDLREAIAAMQGVDPDHVQITTGAAEGLWILFFLAAEPGANVIVPRPGFPPNEAMPESLRLDVRSYNLRPENAFRIDVEEIRRLVDRQTRLVLVNTPHNPTGAVLAPDEMTAIHDLCADRGIPFVSDEVYHPIYHGASMWSAARLVHATVLGDFSKAFSLSGLRIGWMIERDAARREQYETARSYFTVTGTALGERLAALAVRHREAIFSRAQEISARNLSALDGFFADHGDIVRWVRPSGGMTAFPWLASGSDSRDFCRRLAGEGILVAPGDCFGIPEHFRLGFGVTDEGFADSLAHLAQSLESGIRG